MKNRIFANCVVTMGAISSGALLVLGPFFSVTTERQNQLPYYFLIYILTNIVANKYLTKVMDRKGGKYYLDWSFKLRVLLMLGTIPFVIANNAVVVVTLLSIGAALPDALLRSAYPTYVKKIYQEDELQKINANYSVFRQVGYVVGTGLSGLLISSSIIFVLAGLVGLSIISLIILGKMHKDSKIKHHLKNLNQNKLRFWHFLISEHLLILYFSILMMLVVGFILPMSLAPFVVGHLQKTATTLGMLEAAFSCGAFAGAYFYGRRLNSWVAPTMLLLASFLLASVYLVSFKVLLPFFVVIGLVLQCSIWFFTRLHIATSEDRIGEVITNLYFHATLVAALYMAVFTILPNKMVDKSYYLVALLLFVAFVMYIVDLKISKNHRHRANEVQ